MALTTSTELDPIFRNALKHLHSRSSDSAEKIRINLDELIKQRFGSSKMLANTLNKKVLAEECVSPGYLKKTTESKPPPKAVIPDPVQIDESELLEDEMDDNPLIEEDHLKELEDLMCGVCKRMDVNVRNRLVECIECSSLYHQDCHKPPISENDANDITWQCTTCKVQLASTKTLTTPTKSHSSSSSSSTHHHKSSSKNYESSSSSSSTESKKSKSTSSSKKSSSKSIKRESPSGSSSSSKTITPNINIISADKRLQIMKKKAAKLQETKRKHK